MIRGRLRWEIGAALTAKALLLLALYLAFFAPDQMVANDASAVSAHVFASHGR